MANAFTLFGEIKVDTEKFRRDLGQAERTLKSTHREIETVERSATGLGSSFSKMSGSVLAAGAAFAAIGAAALVATRALADLLKTTADYGSEIYDASQKTGLGAQSISALRYAAETSGSSFEKVTGAVSKFNVLLGEAALGNDKARATLNAFRITAQDTDTALQQAIRAIVEETDVTKQAATAKALFKDRTADILPVIKAFDGDLPGLISKLNDLGLTMSDEAAQASDEFGDTLDTLMMQAKATGRTFAIELMPQVTRAMADISAWMAANKETAKAWGQGLSDAADGAAIAYRGFKSLMDGFFTALTLGFASTAQKASMFAVAMRAAVENVIPLVSVLISLNRLFGEAKAGAGMGGGVNIPDFVPSLKTGGAGGGRAGSADNRATDLLARETRAQIEVAENALKEAEQTFSKFLKASIGGLGSYWSFTNTQLLAAISQLMTFRESVLASDRALKDLEDAGRTGLTISEAAALTQKQQSRRNAIADLIQSAIVDFKRAISEGQADLADGVIDSMRDFSERARGGIDSLSESVKAELDQIKVAWDELDAGMEPPAVDKWGFFWYTMKQGIKDFKESLPSLKQSLGENLLNTLYSIGDVFAQAVMQWDGTAKGFFKSLAQGFRQLISQLISELIRLMVMKAVLQLIGAIAGGIGGGGGTSNHAGVNGGLGNLGGMGDIDFGAAAPMGGGGVAANIAGGFAAPAMAMAGGGSVANSTFNNSVTVNLAGGGGTAQTAEQVARVVMLKLSQMQNRNK